MLFFLAGHQQEISKVEYDRGVWYNLKTSLKENKLAMICLILLGVIMIASLLAPLSSYDPDAMDLRSKLQLPSKEHFLERIVLEEIILQELYMEEEFH